jgi:hypothetical protein
MSIDYELLFSRTLHLKRKALQLFKKKIHAKVFNKKY